MVVILKYTSCSVREQRPAELSRPKLSKILSSTTCLSLRMLHDIYLRLEPPTGGQDSVLESVGVRRSVGLLRGITHGQKGMVRTPDMGGRG